MMKKKTLAIFLVLIGVTFFFAGWGKTEEVLLKGDILQQIIELVVENNPILQSQRSLLEQIQALPNPGKGIDFQLSLRGGMATYADENNREIWTGPSGGVGLEIPLFSSSRRKDRIMTRLTYAKELEKAKQDYLSLKNSIISELLAQLNKLFGLQNEKKKLEELKSFLSSNIESLKQQVKTGVIKANAVWDLSERIMNTEAKIYNQCSELEILKREIALNLGGEKSEQLRQMLEQLRVEHLKEKNLE
ncbi:MAG: TolC family protein [bacterium]